MGKQKDTIIQQFVTVVRRRVSPCKIILFGSRAKGNAQRDSDYDFLLVSPVFRQWQWEERGARVYALKRSIPAAMDILCFTPEEFEKKKKEIGIVQEAWREGLEV